MPAVGVYDQIKRAFQDRVAPEIQAIRGDLRVLDERLAGWIRRSITSTPA